MQLDIIIRPEGKGNDRIFTASSLQIPNIVTQGNSVEQAGVRLREALQLYFEEAPEEKNKLIQIIKVDDGGNFPFLSKITI